MIFEVHHMFFTYNVCPNEYMDLLPRRVSGTTLEDIEPMRRKERRGSQKKTSIISHIFLNTTIYKICYNLALTKDLGIYYSRGTICLAIVNTIESKATLILQ